MNEEDEEGSPCVACLEHCEDSMRCGKEDVITHKSEKKPEVGKRLGRFAGNSSRQKEVKLDWEWRNRLAEVSRLVLSRLQSKGGEGE